MTCPRCDAPHARWLLRNEGATGVDYYDCIRCAHVWTVSRDRRRRVDHVTPLGIRLVGPEPS